jgi:parvulin-like peptidyl-prolyl isomerase
MVGREKKGRAAWGWRRLTVGAGCAAALAAAGWGGSLLLAQTAGRTPAPAAAAPAPAPEAPPAPSDYARRPVAFLHDGVPVTREQLGEYLIARFGAEKLEPFLNKLVVEDACRAKNVTVAAAEVEAALVLDMQGLGVDQKTFVHELLRSYHKSLYEWKEDVIRPKLLLGKLCRGRVGGVSDAELRDAFEAAYGEKVQCRAIYWSKAKWEASGQAEYAAAAKSEDAFAQTAHAQEDLKLAATGGEFPPMSRTKDGGELEKAAFMLQPSEISEPITSKQGDVVVLKCDKRLPPDTTVSLETPSVRERVRAQLFEKKVQEEIEKFVNDLLAHAKVEKLLEDPGKSNPQSAGDAGRRLVARVNGAPVTREQFGEYLIARYGAEKLDLFLNKIIIEEACRAKGVAVGDAEVEAAYAEDLRNYGVNEDDFVKKILKTYRKSLYEWKEDVIRPKLLMGKLCRGRVTVAEDDLRQAFEAYYGEKIKCRIIYWPKEEERRVMREYPKLRDDDKEFTKEAKKQPNPRLAADGGKLTLGRHTTGDEELEKEIFKLQPNEVSTLINKPEGLALIKCDDRIPPVAGKSLDDPEIRDRLSREVFEKKVQAEVPVVFKELQAQAKVKKLLADPNHIDQSLVEEAKEMLGALAEPGKAPDAGGH